jgi:hypothetical protein
MRTGLRRHLGPEQGAEQMTDPRINIVARSLAKRVLRRRLLGGLGGGLVAAAGFLLVPKATAVCQNLDQECGEEKGCCRGASCEHGRCACAAGWEACDGRCVDPARDPNHCGRCGKSCAGNKARRTCCGGACVDSKNDRSNCGACGVACGDHEMCVLGVCLGCPIDRIACGTVCCTAERCIDGRCLRNDP